MKIQGMLILLALFSCKVTKQKNSRNVPDIEVGDTKSKNQKMLSKAVISSLTASLVAEDFSKKNVSGLLLKSKLDPIASYLQYTICNQDPTSCVTGKMDGLLPDVVYDSPKGDISIRYQPCVLKNLTTEDNCGPEQTLNATHTVDNKAPLYLSLTGGLSLQDVAKRLESAFVHFRVDKARDAFVVLESNLQSVDALVWSRLCMSSAFKQHMIQIQTALSKLTSDRIEGFAILSLGSSVVAKSLLRQWQRDHDTTETQAYVDGLMQTFSNFENLDMSPESTDETLESVVQNLYASYGKNLEDKSNQKILDIFTNIEEELAFSNDASDL
jgi:hypothetical protein